MAKQKIATAPKLIRKLAAKERPSKHHCVEPKARDFVFFKSNTTAWNKASATTARCRFSLAHDRC